jgi:caffeoyl-CoA O-methyltransferase
VFHDIPEAMLRRMDELMAADDQDRADGTPRLQRLRQIPPETGKLLAILAAGSPEGEWLEIGTSAGYSTMWLSLACRAAGHKLRTFELLEEKIAMAQETFAQTGIEDVVELVVGDAREQLPAIKDVAFCFLDAEKEIYSDCYEALIPNLVPGGLLVADNVISHQEDLQPFLDRAEADERVDVVVIPIGKGLLLCRRL